MKRITLAAGLVGLILAAGPGSTLAQAPGKHSLDGAFDKYDLNKDGYLDAAELAKAFRGASAKPVEHKETGKAHVETQHPDHAFLEAWDADKDEKISKGEFEKYEQQALADARAFTNRGRTYTRYGRSSYRAPRSHRGYSSGRGYGTNPYVNQLRYQQRLYQQQRQAYSNLLRYGAYSPRARGGYRGTMTHRGRRR